jgi:hypothetical protein
MTTIGRRRFVRDSLNRLLALLEDRSAQPTFELSSLGGLSDGRLGRLIPTTLEASDVRAEGERFVVSRPGAPPEPLFEAGSLEEDAWSRMDGRSTIRQIADALAVEWSVTGDAAFARTRRLFLHLVDLRLCLPCNQLE